MLLSAGHQMYEVKKDENNNTRGIFILKFDLFRKQLKNIFVWYFYTDRSVQALTLATGVHQPINPALEKHYFHHIYSKNENWLQWITRAKFYFVLMRVCDLIILFFQIGLLSCYSSYLVLLLCYCYSKWVSTY